MAQAEAHMDYENPVGVGEHPDIVHEVEKLLKQIKDAKEMLDELKIGGDMWLSAIKLAVQAGSHIYKNKQQTKMLMADAQMHHAETR